jgi:hypothetical protein
MDISYLEEYLSGTAIVRGSSLPCPLVDDEDMV